MAARESVRAACRRAGLARALVSGCLAVGIMLWAELASASVVVNYNFDDGTSNASAAASGVTAAKMNTPKGTDSYPAGNPSTGKALACTAWKTAGNDFDFKLTLGTGLRLILGSLTFDDMADANGPTGWTLSHKIGTAAYVTDTSGTVPAAFAATPMTTVSLTGIAELQNVSSDVTLRLTAPAATSDLGKWYIDNVVVSGDTQAMAKLSTSVTTAPAAKVLTGTAGLQYVLTTTNNAVTGGTAAAEQLSYTLSLSAGTGLSFVSNSGTNLDRGAANTNSIAVDASTSGAKTGTLAVASNAYQSSLPTLSTVQVYRPALLTVTGGSAISITNAAASDGASGQRAAARVLTLVQTAGDADITLTGLKAGAHGPGGGTVIQDDHTTNGNPSLPGAELNGTYSATWQLGFEHDDATIVGTAAADLGTFVASVSKTVTGHQGNLQASLAAGRSLAGLSGTSNKTKVTVATFADGAMAAAGTVATVWRAAVAAEGPNGTNLASDVLTLTGTGNSTYVLQMTYDSTAIPSGTPQLGWFSNSQWTNAVVGNSGGVAHFVGTVAYNPSLHFALGNYGVDTVSKTVWAVLNHGSDFAVMVAAPAAPSNPSPADGQAGVAAGSTLSWSAAASGVTFDVYFDAVNPPVQKVATGQAGATFAPASLQLGRTYYWQVVAKNIAGSAAGAVWSFTVQVAAPGAPSNPSPANGQAGVAAGSTLSWSAAGSGVTFDVYFDTVNPPVQKVATGRAAATFTPASLEAGVTYYWKVVASNAGGQVAGPVWSFTVQVVAPGAPSNPSPANGQAGVAAGSTLSWSAAGGGVTFDVYFDTVNPPVRQVATGQPAATFTPASLEAGVTYYWKVVASNAGGQVAGPVWSFTVQVAAPGAPSNPSPSDGQTGVAASAVLSWDGAASDVTFDVYFDTVNPPVRQVATGQPAATFTPASLEAGVTYYWKVVATNSGGQTSGPVWSFTVVVLGDINADGHVDAADLLRLASSFGRTSGQAGFDRACDLNGDGGVNVIDLLILADSWGM